MTIEKLQQIATNLRDFGSADMLTPEEAVEYADAIQRAIDNEIGELLRDANRYRDMRELACEPAYIHEELDEEFDGHYVTLACATAEQFDAMQDNIIEVWKRVKAHYS